MERYAKGFRSFGGFLILMELIVFFLPVTERAQEGYATQHWSQFHYIKALFGGSLPHTGEGVLPVDGGQVVFILACMVLPLLLGLVAGIWGIVGSPRQWGSSVLIFIAAALYVVQALCLDMLWPQAQLTQVYTRGSGCLADVAVAGCSAVLAVVALISTPKKVRKAVEKIPQVEELKQQQAEARYNIIMEGQGQPSIQGQSFIQEQAQEKTVQEPRMYTPGEPRGVMVGLAGVYAGAEIPMADGEFVRLGRQNTNHLIFEDQMRVSRDHCKIKWDAGSGKYVICDYSSTGSFVNGSEDCLPQNLELFLEPGSVVALGDDTNTFRLE